MPTTRADAHLCGLSAPRLDLRSRGKLRCRPIYRRAGNHRVRSPARGCCKVCYVGLHRCIHFRCRRNTTGVLSTGFMTSTSVRTGLRAEESRIRTFRPSPDQSPSELVEPCAETTWRAHGEFLLAGPIVRNPSPSSRESGTNCGRLRKSASTELLASAALLPYSPRPCYAGIGEFSVVGARNAWAAASWSGSGLSLARIDRPGNRAVTAAFSS